MLAPAAINQRSCSRRTPSARRNLTIIDIAEAMISRGNDASVTPCSSPIEGASASMPSGFCANGTRMSVTGPGANTMPAITSTPAGTASRPTSRQRGPAGRPSGNSSSTATPISRIPGTQLAELITSAMSPPGRDPGRITRAVSP